MLFNIPPDISAEPLFNYLSRSDARVAFKGNHKRNAYEDVLSVSQEDDKPVVELSRKGIYDILPEALFHPIDRFENIPANEYKEKFAEEYEAQQAEESNARRFFAPFDRFIFGLGCEIDRLKNDAYGDNSVLVEIICDGIPAKYKDNRFVKRMMPYTPLCGKLRGNRTLITLILRKILRDEGIVISEKTTPREFKDDTPRYNTHLDSMAEGSEDYYLGNVFIEPVVEYEILYWDVDECGPEFLSFVSQIKVFEEFVNEYFVGIETRITFNISTDTLPIRLSDDLYCNYLDYNANL